MSNYVVRVIDRKRIFLGDKEFPGQPHFTRSVINFVVEAKNSSQARKMARAKYGHLAIFGFIRKTALEVGVYTPIEKGLVGA
jgi:hypothetical protein